MIIDGGINYRLIDRFNVDYIESKISSIKSDEWYKYKYRQERYKDHNETFSIPLIWSEKFSEVNAHENYQMFEDEIKEIELIVRKRLCSSGGLMSAVFINLPTGKSIGRHKDASPIGDRFNRCHRIHIPIITNDYCLFDIDGEIKNLKRGEVWEISNVNKFHSVTNNGSTDRIHLLLDWDPLLHQSS